MLVTALVAIVVITVCFVIAAALAAIVFAAISAVVAAAVAPIVVIAVYAEIAAALKTLATGSTTVMSAFVRVIVAAAWCTGSCLAALL